MIGRSAYDGFAGKLGEKIIVNDITCISNDQFCISDLAFFKR